MTLIIASKSLQLGIRQISIDKHEFLELGHSLPIKFWRINADILRLYYQFKFSHIKLYNDWGLQRYSKLSCFPSKLNKKVNFSDFITYSAHGAIYMTLQADFQTSLQRVILIKFGRLLQPLVVECIGYYADKLPTHAVSHKISQVHHRRVVFGREPSATLSYFLPTFCPGYISPGFPRHTSRPVP